ncbi:Fic family protein [Lonepinella koalarum]|uniref:Fic family protein n=1 Tax=Lonepinella koalarum TaxID=53417 RepID=UPI0011E41678|nr:Fic family protein [Lonepinella koalarum]TYG34657.1 Fic family protein [Lonepinella koalarum]
MRTFDYQHKPQELLTPDIVKLLSGIREHRGKQDLFIEANPDILASLLNAAKIQSTKASNQIEGIFTSDKRLAELMAEKTEPSNRSEQEIVGYREVLNTIHENYEYIGINPNYILQLHQLLYSFTNERMGGQYKNQDNSIAEIKEDGSSIIRFKPTSAFETPQAIQDLCTAYNQAVKDDIYDPLLLSGLFILDFLCIHPFNDGNGRMSRLLTLLLLYRADFIVGKYISLELLIEKSKESYYEVLQQSSQNWHEEKNDYKPFIRYYLGIILKAYRDFESRVSTVQIGKLSKAERIEYLLQQTLGKISKQDILMRYPDISKITVERTLATLLKQGKISKVGVGKNTAYVYHHA